MEPEAIGMLDGEASDRAVIFVACRYSCTSIGLRVCKGVVSEGWEKKVDVGSYRCEQFGF